MTYAYEFVNGKVEIEVDESWRKVLVELDHEERLNDLAQTRRHYKFEELDYLSIMYSDRYHSTDMHHGEDYSEISSRCVLSAIEQLPRHDRIIVQMKFFDGYSQTEIAEMNGVNKATISRKISRIMKDLKNILKKMDLDNNF